MTQKQKAKAYDEALKVANKYKDTHIMFPLIQDEMFPELRESEDEKIRKELIEFVKSRGGFKQEYIAWLEKQSRNPYSGVSFEYNDNVWGMCARDNGVDILFNKKLIQHISGEKQGEQKPVDKSEPKFKQGDWIIFNGLVLRVGAVAGGFYVATSKDGITNGYDCDIDNAARLWSIQDVKDGDVLAVENIIFIYKRTLANHIVSYCKLINDVFESTVDARTCCEGNTYVHPATKEQRDLLFQKMKEKGYRWDFDKKELKKIEQNPAWSEKDEINSNICIRLMQTHSLCDKNIITWFESLKYRVQPKQDSTDRFFEGFKKGEQSVIENYGKYRLCKPTEWSEEDEMHIRELESLVKRVWAIAEHENDKETIHKMSDLSFFLKTLKPQQKQEWDEEDEKTIHLACEFIRHHSNHNDSIGGIDCSILIERLKSLRPRSQWNPSVEQMIAIETAINVLGKGTLNGKQLIKLQEDLEKLKGEHS